MMHPSKKQQQKYQQQLGGRGYSPSYNQLVSKEPVRQQSTSHSHVGSYYQNKPAVRTTANMQQMRTQKTSYPPNQPVNNSQKKSSSTGIYTQS